MWMWFLPSTGAIRCRCSAAGRWSWRQPPDAGMGVRQRLPGSHHHFSRRWRESRNYVQPGPLARADPWHLLRHGSPGTDVDGGHLFTHPGYLVQASLTAVLRLGDPGYRRSPAAAAPGLVPKLSRATWHAHQSALVKTPSDKAQAQEIAIVDIRRGKAVSDKLWSQMASQIHAVRRFVDSLRRSWR